MRCVNNELFEWHNNLVKLKERCINEELFNILLEAGPETSEQVNEIASMSDEELKQLNELYHKFSKHWIEQEAQDE